MDPAQSTGGLSSSADAQEHGQPIDQTMPSSQWYQSLVATPDSVAATAPDTSPAHADTSPSMAKDESKVSLAVEVDENGSTSWREAQQMHRGMAEEIWLRSLDQVLNTGDTLIFIDYEPPTDGPTEKKRTWNCRGYAWTSKQFRMESEKLLRTGSTKFAQMLAPTYQFRTLRRRKMVNKLPEGVKFVIDLTPPSQEDELVIQIMELSLTPALMDWWKSEIQIGNSHVIVGGHDDICQCPNYRYEREYPHLRRPCDIPRDSGIPPDYEVRRIPKDHEAPSWITLPTNEISLYREKTSEWITINKPTYRNIPDYCPVRHRACIARLMLLISGRDLVINSAPQLWTLVGVAKLLDCTRVLALRNSVMIWMSSGINTMFLEALPEEAVKIGFAMEMPEVATTAFAVLVHERAIYEAGRPNTNNESYELAKHTVFGRKKGDPGDDIDTLVAYASEALIKRVTKCVAKLLRPGLWVEIGVPEAVKLRKLTNFLQAIQNDDRLTRYSSGVTDPRINLTIIPLSCLKNLLGELARANEGVVASKKVLDSGEETLKRGAAWNITAEDVRTLRTPLTGPVPSEAVPAFLEKYSQLSNVQRALLPSFFYGLAMHFHRKWEAQSHPVSVPFMANMAKTTADSLELLFQESPGLLPDFKRVGIRRHPAIDQYMVFDWTVFKAQAFDRLMDFSNQMWKTTRMVWGANHRVLNLGPDETQYLPLWAGGNNDGSGGVFQPTPPPALLGPSGPGPSFHTGLTISSAVSTSSTTGSVRCRMDGMALTASTVSSGFVKDMEGMDVQSIATLTGFGSLETQDSHTTTDYNRNRVVALDDRSTTRSETLSDSMTEYDDARHAVPAMHQEMEGVAVDDEAYGEVHHVLHSDIGNEDEDKERGDFDDIIAYSYGFEYQSENGEDLNFMGGSLSHVCLPKTVDYTMDW